MGLLEPGEIMPLQVSLRLFLPHIQVINEIVDQGVIGTVRLFSLITAQLILKHKISKYLSADEVYRQVLLEKILAHFLL